MAKKSTASVKSEAEVLDVLSVSRGRIEACVIGTSPYVCNRMSEKAKRTLLLPSRKKNAVEKQTTLKHDPIQEFRDSPYVFREADAPTLLGFKKLSFKKAMAAAALDLPGTKKAEIGRRVWVADGLLHIYGVPQIYSTVVRMPDMNRTPDIRTRAILPKWAARVEVEFVQPLVTAQAVVRLLAAAGLFIGVGDGRNEKGTMSSGMWELVEPTDPTFLEIVENGGRAAQVEAMENPVAYDDETAELLAWFEVEVKRRQLQGVA